MIVEFEKIVVYDISDDACKRCMAEIEYLQALHSCHNCVIAVIFDLLKERVDHAAV